MTLLSDLLAPIQRWRSMRDLRSLDQQDAHDYKWDFKGMIFDANEAVKRDMRGRAKEIWDQAYRRFPDLAMTSEAALELMLELRLFDDAEAVMNRALKRYPRDMQVREGLALVAAKRGDHAEAVRRCEILWKKYPQSHKAIWIGAASLGQLGRIKEAEATLARGLKLAPKDLYFWIEYARLAERNEDWDEALKRWTYVHETLGHLIGTIGIATTLAGLGRYDEADAVITGVFYRSGDNMGVWLAYAGIAEKKQDWEEAASRWVRVRERFPQSVFSYTSALRALEQLKRPEAAEAILIDGIGRLPNEASLRIEYARLADRRSDWVASAERWAIVRERFPDMREAYMREANALDALDRPEDAASIRARMPA